MKVYVITFPYLYDNYGTRLQNYALNNALTLLENKKKLETVNLCLYSFRDFLKDAVRFVVSCLPFSFGIDKFLIWKLIWKRRPSFRSFLKKLQFMKVSRGSLSKLDFTDSIAIAGSDQIWNPLWNPTKKADQDRAYFFFLRFAPREKRYSYAPSFGIAHIPENLREIYSKYLSEFNSLSVREEAGEKIIHELTGLDVPLMPDPVFLLTPSDWHTVAEEADDDFGTEKYVITYLLGKHSREFHKNIKEYANSRGLKLITVDGTYYTRDAVIPSPFGFVKLIRDAEAVFTDSFHAIIFSMIMETPFALFHKPPDPEQFSRLSTLLGKYGMQYGFFADEKTASDFEPIFERERSEGFYSAKKVMERERVRGLEYLRNILEQGGRNV